MIKRPLSPQFADLVTSGRKTTTIRKTPWPVEGPIMLYRWEGKAYRSRQIDVAVVKVLYVYPVLITHHTGGQMVFERDWLGVYFTDSEDVQLWQSEGFASPEAMDGWFRERIQSGKTVEMALMGLRVIHVPDVPRELRTLARRMDSAASAMRCWGAGRCRAGAAMDRHAEELRRAAKAVRSYVQGFKRGKLL